MLTFHECCLAILKDPKTDSYAKGYANAGLRIWDVEGECTQAQYILCNLNNWRGETAREVKAALKEIGG
jgi:hypothetical protein